MLLRWRCACHDMRATAHPALARRGYAHVGHAVYLRGGSEVEVQHNTTQALGEGLSLPDLTPAVGAVVAAKVGWGS